MLAASPAARSVPGTARVRKLVETFGFVAEQGTD